jgi:Flp pilus assembly protein TadG
MKLGLCHGRGADLGRTGKPIARSGRKAVGLPREFARLPKPTVQWNRTAEERLDTRVVYFWDDIKAAGEKTNRLLPPTHLLGRIAMRHAALRLHRRRRGAMAVLAAVFLVVMMGMIAFAVDLGYLGVVRAQLQAAADSAALAAAGSSNLTQSQMVAVAQQFANANKAAGRAIQLSAGDVQYGTWDTGTRTFTPCGSGQVGTAVKVTVRTDANSGGATPLFFARALGLASVSQQASAVATFNPRDIAFVVDLSGSMNDDTSPGSSSFSSSLAQQVYSDFGFGTYSGGTATLNTSKSNSWVMTNQMPSVMPSAIPAPNTSSTSSVNYWGSYFTYVKNNSLKLGYDSYLKFMMYNGRDLQPDGASYTPLSVNSASCPKHSETVGGTAFQFPPREMPTHAMRRALIAAIQLIQNRNQTITDPNQRDWVSIITFDKVSSSSPKVQQALTSDYGTAMTACTQLQACSDNALCTCTEAGLSTAYSHIKAQSQGGQGRENANKIVVLLTDGQPNLKQSSSTTVTNFVNNHPSSYTNPATGSTTNNWVSSGSYSAEKNASLMQTFTMQGANWNIYAAGVGGGCDYDFMDRIARMGNTANTNGQGPRGTADASAYEAVVTDIFNKIITNPKLRLVQ